MPPILVNLRLGQKYDVYIGQGGLWGNQYANQPLMSRKQKIEFYERDLRARLFGPGSGWWKAQLADLSGKRIGCHCTPKPCHGEVIVKLFLEIFGSCDTMELDDETGTRGEVGC